VTEGDESEGAKVRRWGALGWTALVALLALASSTVAIVFELWPGLKPDPRTTLGAEVSIFAVDPGVTEGDFLRRTTLSAVDFERRKTAWLRASCGDQATTKACRRVLQIPGEEVYVRTTVEGFKRRSIALRVSIYDAVTHQRERGVSDVDVTRLRLQAPTDTAVVPIWVLCPQDRTRTYFVRVELYHSGDDVLLAVADSKPFRPRRC